MVRNCFGLRIILVNNFNKQARPSFLLLDGCLFICKTWFAMNNAQAIIDGLQDKRAMIERECSDVEAELDRLALIMAGYKDRLDAIDKVIAEFNGQNDSDNTLLDDLSEKTQDKPPFQESLIIEQEPLPDEEKDNKQNVGNGNGGGKLITKGRSSNFRNLVRDEFQKLPSLFTKYDVVKLMEDVYPELKGNINTNTMNGVMRSLVKSGSAKVRHKATGTSSQVYEKKV